MQPLENSHGRTLTLSDYCQLRLSTDDFGKLFGSNIPFTSLQNVIFVGDGLKLKILTRDQHVLKMKPNSQLYKEKEHFNCELEESIDIQAAIDEMYAPVKRERKTNNKGSKGGASRES